MISRPPQTGINGHAGVLVGADSDSWFLKNSWGDKWASSGFCRVLLDALKF